MFTFLVIVLYNKPLFTHLTWGEINRVIARVVFSCTSCWLSRDGCKPFYGVCV